MSEINIMKKLAETLADMKTEMSVEQMRLYQIYVTKSLEVREAEEALIEAMGGEDDDDELNADRLRDIRRVLGDQNYRLSGNECVFLACLSKELEGEDFTDTKRINIFLQSHGRKPANTTKIVDGLEKKRLIEIRSDGLNAHKMYRLTQNGQRSAWSLLDRYSQGGGERLAVID